MLIVDIVAEVLHYVLPVDDIVHFIFFFQAEDGIRDLIVTGVQTCALPISVRSAAGCAWVTETISVATSLATRSPPTSATTECAARPPPPRRPRPRPRRARARRSEERRVGKECRSRWSPYH